MDVSDNVSNIRFGFSSELVFLLWAIWGGFLLMMTEANLLTLLLTPVYEKPIKNIYDVLGMEV